MKKILALLLAAVMVLSLAACSNNAGTPASNPPAEDSTPAENPPDKPDDNQPSGDEEVTLTWAVWDKDTTTQWQTLADGYTALHPNVKFDMIDLGSTDYMTQLATQLSGGNGELDILSIKDIPGYTNLINLEMLEPLNDVLTTPKESLNGVLEQLTDEGVKF